MNLIKQERFGELVCDFYEQKSKYYMTRTQIGEALEYENPNDAIRFIHNRHKDRLDEFSTPCKLNGVEGGREVEREMIYYSLKGVMEICRHSRQPKADAFMDFCWEVMEALLTGEAHLVWNKEERLKIARILSNTPRHAKADVMNVLGLEHTEHAEESEEKLLKGEVEVREILAGLEETGVTQELTATAFKNKFSVLNKYDVRQIGKALNKIGVKKRKTNGIILYEFPK